MARGENAARLDENHALLVGEVMMALHLMEGQHSADHTVVTPEVIDGHHTGRIFIERPSGTYGVVIGRLGRGTLEEYLEGWESRDRS